MYEIRLCKLDELDLLKRFLQNSWSQNHIFVKEQEILDFQHKNQSGYNFVVAYHIEKQEFHGVLGIISPSHYSCGEVTEGDDIWLAIWKVDKELSASMSLGIDLLDYVTEKYQPQSISAIGINETVAPLYKIAGFKVDTMNHWFIPNRSLFERKLIFGDALGAYEANSSTGSREKFTIRELDNESISLKTFLSKEKRKKDICYLNARYCEHPAYSYQYIGMLDNSENMFGLAIGREVSGNGSKAFRLTELFIETDGAFDFCESLQPFLTSQNFEYLDFMEYGWGEEKLKSYGFTSCTETIFVPHLFEPFVREKREVLIAFKSQQHFCCTKGDSDLDRPSIMDVQ